MPDKERKPDILNPDQKINKLLVNIIEHLGSFIEEQACHINQLTAVGRALSTQHEPAAILDMILKQARRFTAADGGTLYLVSDNGQELVFHVVHTESKNIYIGGTSDKPVTLSNIPLFNEKGNPNLKNVSSHVVNTSEVVNIPDVYKAEKFNFQGTKNFDTSLNYHSKSMLVIPMRNHEDRIIGVLQLINAKDPLTKKIISFTDEKVELALALASQAAVVLTQQRLIKEMKDLFESFIRAIATAIDEKSKYTGGHIERVAKLTMLIAEKINALKEGPFGNIHLTHNEMEELRIAAWMHDTGKITTPDYIVDKSNKLETVFDRIELLRSRWEVIRHARQLKAEKSKFDMVKNSADFVKVREIDDACQSDIMKMNKDLEFLVDINKGEESMLKDKLHRLNSIAQGRYCVDGVEYPYLKENELCNLSISNGTLTDEERETVKHHTTMTLKILKTLPWPEKFSNVPSIAGAHHEKLDGSGHPLGLSKGQINLQSRIMAVADIFEALIATDRPYKKPLTISEATNILNLMSESNQIDKDIVELFINSGLHRECQQMFSTNYSP